VHRLSVEGGHREAAEGHREPCHRANVAHHRSRLDEIERHRRQYNRRVNAGAPVEKTSDERIRRKHSEHAPKCKRESSRPLLEAEQLEPQSDRRKRELWTTEIVQVGQRVVGTRQGKTVCVIEI
jgi:hypothetical protein